MWAIRPELILALDERIGFPVDSYVNGSQTWFAPAEGAELEFRLHPVAGYRRPRGLATDEVWEAVVGQLSGEGPPAELSLGAERRTLDGMWEGLECYIGRGADLEPAVLAAAATEAVGIPPDASGMVDHEAIGDAWERTGGAVSIVGLLFDQLRV